MDAQKVDCFGTRFGGGAKVGEQNGRILVGPSDAVPSGTAPLELTDEQATRVLDMLQGAERVVRSSTALAILISIGRNTLVCGDCRLAHEFGRVTGACRRSIDKAVRTLKKHELISRVGTTDNGVAIYRATFDAGMGTS